MFHRGDNDHVVRVLLMTVRLTQIPTSSNNECCVTDSGVNVNMPTNGFEEVDDCQLRHKNLIRIMIATRDTTSSVHEIDK